MKYPMLLLSGLVMLGTAVHAEPGRKPRRFPGKRVIRNHTVVFDYPVERVFPLLCPVREYEWMSSWKGVTAYAESGHAEKYTVFYHKLPFPLMFKKAYWTAAQYEPDRKIQWVVTVPGIAVIIIDEDIEAAPGGKTKIDYTYTATGVSRSGNRIVEKMFAHDRLMREMDRTREEIEHYLATGKMLDTEFKSSMFD